MLIVKMLPLPSTFSTFGSVLALFTDYFHSSSQKTFKAVLLVSFYKPDNLGSGKENYPEYYSHCRVQVAIDNEKKWKYL